MENSAAFLPRFWQYQKERFPLYKNGFLITIFTFSSVAYSRVCRGADGFISAEKFFAGAVCAVLFFFLLRIFDEFKDADDDAKFRPYRPVPRGLIKFSELRNLAIGIIFFQILLIAIFLPKLFPAYFLAGVYLVLMTKEFFAPEWLKARPVLYLISHMLILPMIDFFTMGLDWMDAGLAPPRGLEFFLVTTFLNGIVIEIGRKIRAKEAEEFGVETYSALYGARRATLIWIAVVVATFFSASAAAYFAGFGFAGFIVLGIFLLIAIIPAAKFYSSQDQKDAQKIELLSGIWTIGMYLTLGAVPLILKYFL